MCKPHRLQAVRPALAESVQPSPVQPGDVVHDRISVDGKGCLRHPRHIHLQLRMRPVRPGPAAYPSLYLLPVAKDWARHRAASYLLAWRGAHVFKASTIRPVWNAELY